jgi:hypothetical protein
MKRIKEVIHNEEVKNIEEPEDNNNRYYIMAGLFVFSCLI